MPPADVSLPRSSSPSAIPRLAEEGDRLLHERLGLVARAVRARADAHQSLAAADEAHLVPVMVVSAFQPPELELEPADAPPHGLGDGVVTVLVVDLVADDAELTSHRVHVRPTLVVRPVLLVVRRVADAAAVRARGAGRHAGVVDLAPAGLDLGIALAIGARVDRAGRRARPALRAIRQIVVVRAVLRGAGAGLRGIAHVDGGPAWRTRRDEVTARVAARLARRVVGPGVAVLARVDDAVAASRQVEHRHVVR